VRALVQGVTTFLADIPHHCPHFRNVAVVKSSSGRSDVSHQIVADATIVVGTSCVATGTDIPGAKTIVIVGLPYSIEQLLQWAGRLRRDNGTVYVLVTEFALREVTELSGKGYIWFGYVYFI
jgi:superfamily II DNA or RNA helicase